MDGVSYSTLNHKRAAQLAQLTKIAEAINNFDPLRQTIHVLKALRENLARVEGSHNVIINEMLSHADADFRKIDEDLDRFRAAHCDSAAMLEAKVESIDTESTQETLVSLSNEIAALNFSLTEFESFADNDDTDCISISELRMRLRVLQPLHANYLLTWNQIFTRSDAERKEEWKEKRKNFNATFFKTIAWFDNEIESRSPRVENRTLSSAQSVRLPTIELPKFDGSPDLWIAFRDAFKSIVHNVESLSGAIKFRYLKTSITDKHSPINHLLESDDGYEEAWQAVTEFYDDKRRIVDCHFAGLLTIKPMIAETHEELQRVLNDYSLHIASLERMHNEEELYRAILAHLVIQRLDPHTRDLWETENRGSIPFWPDIQRFLKERRKTLSSMPAPKVFSTTTSVTAHQASSSFGNRNNRRKTSVNVANKVLLSAPAAALNQSSAAPVFPTSQNPPQPSSIIRKCFMCSAEHRLHLCPQFLNLPIPQRLAKVKEWRICTNCFGAHALNACTSPYKCRSCQQRHHTMLHLEQCSTNAHLPQQTHSLHASAKAFVLPGASCNTASTKTCSITLLQTAMVDIQDVYGEWHRARAFLDSGSDSNYISTNVAVALKLPMEPTYVEASGLGGSRAAVIRHKVRAIIGRTTENMEMECLVTPKVTNSTPILPINPRNIGIPLNLSMADPSFCAPGKIDILIGNKYYGKCLRDGLIPLASGPVLINSIFGWLFSGGVPQLSSEGAHRAHTITTQCFHSTLVDLRNSVEKFYKLEDYRKDKRFLTDEEAHCEEVFELTHTRSSTGRITVLLPLKENIAQMVNNYRSTLCQFLANEKRLQKHDVLRALVIDFMREYERLGHMTEIDVSGESFDAPAFYFPHHAVEKEDSSTTAVRVVFNGSARTASGLSFNDTQCIGPQIQSDSFTLLIRFRQHPIIIKADVAKMYRQVDVALQQRKYQRIFWRESPQERLKVYSLNTVTYGTAAASFQATRSLKQLAIDNMKAFPEAAQEVIDNFYIDDYISGAKTVKEATKLAAQVSDIIASGEMKLRKFNSNSEEFLRSIPEEDRESPKPGATIKTLGIKWDPVTDTIGFDVKPIVFDKITRRTIMSEIAKRYDPEGRLGPVIFRFKLFLKAIFKLNMPWDAPLSDNEASEWKKIASTFTELNKIQIPRLIVHTSFVDVQLHGFSDASNLGYGAAIYVRSQDSSGNTMCNLLCAKSRIAPNEYRSTARLELCGAVILALLMEQAAKALKLSFSRKVCWSDSAITLHWLKKSPSQLQTFVANRVSEIQEISKELEIIWRHVSGPLNPSDLISRGMNPADIVGHGMWWNGPEFLLLHENQWPSSIVSVDPNEASYANEFKKIESLVFATSAHQNTPVDDANPFLEWIENSSRSWALKKKLSPVMRFIFNSRARKFNKPRRAGPTQVNDMVDAEHAIARICQVKYFREEFYRCASKKSVPASSSIKNLDPIWDSKLKLMRVGGRLQHANQCTDDHKHPIILPKCHFTKIVIRETHQQHLHAGQNATLGLVRLRYWPMRAKPTIRQEVHKCIKCIRARPKLLTQFMGQLPTERSTPAPPFYHTGVDYCGPFDIKLSSNRSARTGKAYVALFVCLATKAIHMEIVSDLTTEAFFSAFDKFVSRRGLARTMHSDNGLNFVGAKNQLLALADFLAKSTTQAEIQTYLAKQEIEWKFIPARAPEHGGLWEAGVKSMKHHFHRVAKNALLTFEEFDRLKCKIEAILNSRPLTAISDDPSDLSALTAGHFLIGRPLVAKPEHDLTQFPINRLKRWERVVQIQQHFWKRWSCEYLHQLQVRTKNFKEKIPVAIGQLVLLHIDNTPPMLWPLGRIIDIFPGKDGITRVATIRTAKSTYKRPVNKLAILPISTNDDQLEPAEDVRD